MKDTRGILIEFLFEPLEAENVTVCLGQLDTTAFQFRGHHFGGEISVDVRLLRYVGDAAPFRFGDGFYCIP